MDLTVKAMTGRPSRPRAESLCDPISPGADLCSGSTHLRGAYGGNLPRGAMVALSPGGMDQSARHGTQPAALEDDHGEALKPDRTIGLGSNPMILGPNPSEMMSTVEVGTVGEIDCRDAEGPPGLIEGSAEDRKRDAEWSSHCGKLGMVFCSMNDLSVGSTLWRRWKEDRQREIMRKKERVIPSEVDGNDRGEQG